MGLAGGTEAVHGGVSVLQRLSQRGSARLTASFLAFGVLPIQLTVGKRMCTASTSLFRSLSTSRAIQLPTLCPMSTSCVPPPLG